MFRRIVAGWARNRPYTLPKQRVARLRAFVAEWYSAALAAGGWACLTAGIAALTSPLAWLFSAGLLLLLLVGLRPLGVVFVEGLDSLSGRKPKPDA